MSSSGSAACGAGLLVALLAGPSVALSLFDTSPLYFDGVGGSGFAIGAVAAAGLTPRFEAGATDQWISAGVAGLALPIAIDQQLGPAHQLPAAPSPLDPIIADSTWRITNASAGSLVDPLLVFLMVDPNGSYPSAPPVALDANLLEILAYSYAGTDYAFGVIQLPDLAPGQFSDVILRYVVGGSVGSPPRFPDLGVAVLGSYAVVPEPGSFVLVGIGLIASAALRRAPRNETPCRPSRSPPSS